MAGTVAVNWVPLTKVVVSRAGELPHELHRVTIELGTKLEPKTESVAKPEPADTPPGEMEVMAGLVTEKDCGLVAVTLPDRMMVCTPI